MLVNGLIVRDTLGAGVTKRPYEGGLGPSSLGEITTSASSTSFSIHSVDAVFQFGFCLGLVVYGGTWWNLPWEGGGCVGDLAEDFGDSLSSILAKALSCGACVTGSSS